VSPDAAVSPLAVPVSVAVVAGVDDEELHAARETSSSAR
jgi:hypothetical protein